MTMDIFRPLWLSLEVAVIAVLATAVVGVSLAWFFAKRKFPGKDIVESLLLLPMVLPPSVLGYLLLLAFGKRGFLGIFLEKTLHTSLIFTKAACVVASFVVALPLMYQQAKSAFSSVDPRFEHAARTLGAGEWRIFRKVTLPLAWQGIMGGCILSFARALGEFGATMMVAGNIPGKTRTVSVAIYYAVENGDPRTANILMGIILVISFGLIFTMNRRMQKKRVH